MTTTVELPLRGGPQTLGFMLKGRSLAKPFLLYLEWAVWSVPMLKGFLETPRDPDSLVVEDVIARIEVGGRVVSTRDALAAATVADGTQTTSRPARGVAPPVPSGRPAS